MFIASPGCKWIMSDYSQIELRCAAHCANEEVWIKAFWDNVDLHSATAKASFNIPCEVKNVKKADKCPDCGKVGGHDAERQDAKRVNFGILYGMSVWGLASELKISQEDAEVFLKKYYSGLPGLGKWIEDTHKSARELGYVANPFGRRRRLPDLMQYVPSRPPKPQGAPECFNKRGEVPNLLKSMRGVSLKDNMHLFLPENATFWQQQAAQIRNPKFQKCTTCSVISQCILSDEAGRLQGKINEALRQSVNAIVQSFASDLAGMAFTAVLATAKSQGIPLMLTSDVRGIAPVNIVHDDIISIRR
jgi:DNA polymerase I-like protein with 3'-5' exonuclease and polymerase domains